MGKLFITATIGIAANGLYVAANKIPGIVNLVAGIFQQAWNLSAFQAFRDEGRDAFYRAVHGIYNALMASVCVVLIPLSAPLASLFLQGGFYDAWYLIPLLDVACYYSVMSSFLGSVYTASMRTKYLFTTTIVGAVLCLLLTVLLVGRIGITGAAVATLASNVAVYVMRLVDSKKIVDVGTRPAVCIGDAVLLIGSAACQTSVFSFSVPICVACTLAVLFLHFRDFKTAFKILKGGANDYWA